MDSENNNPWEEIENTEAANASTTHTPPTNTQPMENPWEKAAAEIEKNEETVDTQPTYMNPTENPQGEIQKKSENPIPGEIPTDPQILQLQNNMAERGKELEEARKELEETRKELEERRKDIAEIREVIVKMNQRRALPQPQEINPPEPEPTPEPTKPETKEEQGAKILKLDEEIKKNRAEAEKAKTTSQDKEKTDEERFKAFQKNLNLDKQNRSLQEKKIELEDAILGLTPIPLPMRKVMDEIFDKEYRVKKDNIAFTYALKEEEYFKDAIKRRRESLRNDKDHNFTAEEIEVKILAESSLIRESIQSHLKRRITNDIKRMTLDLIEKNPQKYGNLDKSITEAIENNNLTGKILEQRVWAKWYPKTIKENDKELDPPIKPEPEKKKAKVLTWAKKHIRLLGGVLGGVTGILVSSPVGLQIAGASLLVAGGGFLTGKLSGWRISKLEQQLGEEKNNSEKHAEIEKRIKTWYKIRDIAENTTKFALGFSTGALFGSMLNNQIFGGKGMINYIKSYNQPIPPVAGGGASGKIGSPKPENILEDVETGSIETPVETPNNIEIPIETIQAEIPSSNLGPIFDSGLSYQQAAELGWKGPNLYLTEVGGSNGVLQGEFFKRLVEGLGGDIGRIQNFEAAKIYNEALRRVYGGLPVETGANQAIQALQALLP